MEINVGPFARRVPISMDVDANSAKAIYRGGFLFVTFRKGSGDGDSRRQITITR